MAEPMYIRYGNFLNPRCLRLTSWINKYIGSNTRPTLPWAQLTTDPKCIRFGTRLTVHWAKLTTDPKYIGSGNLSNSWCLGLSSQLSLSVLGLIFYQTHGSFSSTHG
jgi:hypothetical protein